ncbi:MAG: ABC transporter ATP-binding protein [Rhodospirillales bacterium]|nr:ABC transporter ATP-binding protein [Rhodospirillales bacterium]
MTNPHVAFENVEKSYDGLSYAVRHLDLEIRRGEFLTLLGPSGSGKTTTLMMLAGFETPTAGTIRMNGHPIDHLPPHRRELGIVFQSYALFPHMTVGENIAFPLSVRRRPRAEIEARVKRALATVRLEGYADRRPAQLSGGQQQRVALARAMVFEPQLVLMDEPLGALDKKLREHMQIELKRLHAEVGLTVVYVTHDQGEALTMSDRVAVFNNGMLQQVDTPAALYENPANAFVAEFIGDNNLLAATVEANGGGFCAARLAGGTEIRARVRHPAEPGEAVVLSLRPEHIRLGGGDGNILVGTVNDAIYYGDHVRLLVTGPDSGEIVVKLPGRVATPPPGSAVTLAFRAEDCLALPQPVQ